MSDELWRKGALQLAGMIARKEVSSREVVAAHLARIDAVNPHLNAIVRRWDADSLAAADAADAAVSAGGKLGPLHGVPITVKENIDLAGTNDAERRHPRRGRVANRRSGRGTNARGRSYSDRPHQPSRSWAARDDRKFVARRHP